MAVQDGTLKAVATCPVDGAGAGVQDIKYARINSRQYAVILDIKRGNNMSSQFLFWDETGLTNPYLRDGALNPRAHPRDVVSLPGHRQGRHRGGSYVVEPARISQPVRAGGEQDAGADRLVHAQYQGERAGQYPARACARFLLHHEQRLRLLLHHAGRMGGQSDLLPGQGQQHALFTMWAARANRSRRSTCFPSTR